MGRYDQAKDKKTSAVVMGVIAILAAAGWFYVNQPSQQVMEPETRQLQLPIVSDVNNPDETLSDNTAIDKMADDVDLEAKALPEQPVALPELSSSDQAFREAMLGVSAKLAPWLKTSDLIRKYTAIANDFSQGLWLEKHMRFLRQSQAFSVEKTDGGLLISNESYQRYDKLAEAIDGMDTQATVAVYRKFKPLFLEVFDNFGYPPERPLEDIFLKSAAQVLAAPVIEKPIEVVRPSVFYKFADKELEGLSPVAKQMLRMGPKNTRTIQNKIRRLVQELVNTKD